MVTPAASAVAAASLACARRSSSEARSSDVDDFRRRVHHQVLVGVHQPRQQGDARSEVDELGVRGRRGRVLDGHHPAVLDQQVGP